MTSRPEPSGLSADLIAAIPDDVDIVDSSLLTAEQYARVAHTTAGYRYTEYANAQRLAVLFGQEVRWSYDDKAWYVWNGSRWAPDTSGEMMRRAKTVARLLWHELPHRDPDKRKAAVAHATKSETKNSLKATVELAASEKVDAGDGNTITLTCSAADFDTRKHVLNCANGTLDLLTGVLSEHRRSDMHRRITAVAYEPDARSADWERFLSECTGGDDELVDYLQLLAGATLLGTNQFDVLPVIFGPPGSGKSTFIRALLASLGSQYGDSANLETFAERRASSSARDDLARLEGLRMVGCVEGERNHTLAAGLVKKVTGGDAIAARLLFTNTTTWTPEFTLWIAVNERPTLHRDEQGIFRRIKAIPFENQVVEVDPDLRERLSDPVETGPAVLAWAVRGALTLADHRGPLVDPPAVVEAVEEYREEQAAATYLAAWLEESCTTDDENARTAPQELRASYESWCERTGQRPETLKSWSVEMGNVFKRGRTSTGRFYRGVELLASSEG